MPAHGDFPGPEGFLGTRASLMLDVVYLAMFVVVLAQGWSVAQVWRGRYSVHKWTQLTIAALLAVAVTAFEVEMRVFGWRERAADPVTGRVPDLVWTLLRVHLVCSVSTVLLWPVVIVRALKRFPSPPMPGAHSASHVFWARAAAAALFATALTGWAFYWAAFLR